MGWINPSWALTLLDIYYAINFFRKVQRNKPSKEKVFSQLKNST